jgi:predicted RNA-binding protein associated with RNAse of E/G family
MATLTVALIKPLKQRIIRYPTELVRQTPTLIEVRVSWTVPPVDLGLLHFNTGDYLIERFYTDRWYNVFRLHSATGTLKGWYCNITRPALITATGLESEDLELDLLVSADRRQIRLDDEDEFYARNLAHADPVAYHAAWAAVAELRERATSGQEPFDAPVEEDA